MPASIFGNPAAVVQLNQALFGIAPGNGKYTNQLDQANAVGAIPFARQLGQTVAATNEALAATVLANVGIVNATLQTALVQAFAAFPNDRGVVVLNLTNILTTLEGNAVYGAAAAQFNAQVATDFQYSTNSVNTTDSPITAGTVTLTANTDVLTGNVFTAGLVFTPGGDDRINSLQDEDVLTGTGTNPTLNATFGNPNDNGSSNITPTLNGIQTLNVAFSATAALTARLDLQDATGLTNAVNISRVSDVTANVQVDNLLAAVTNLSIANSNSGTATIGLNFAAGALSGAADATTLTLNRVNVVGLSVEDTDNVLGANTGAVGLADGYETINLVSSGSANTVGVLSAEDLRTLNISGNQNLTLGNTATTTGAQGVEATRYGGGLANVAGSLTAINASALTGALDITIGNEIIAGLDGTSGLPVNLTVTGGTGNDTFRLASGTVLVPNGVQAGDRIVGGAGNNTLQLLGNNVVATDGPNNGPTVTQVQTLDIRTGHDSEALVGPVLNADVVNVDARAIADLANVVIRNEGQNRFNGAGNPIVGVAQPFLSTPERMTVNLTNTNAATTNGLVVLHGTTGNNGITNNLINVNSTLAGVTTAGITIQDGINADLRFNANVRFDSNGTALDPTNTIVNVNIRDNDTESNTVQLSEFARHTGTITVTGISTGFLNLDATANAYRYDNSGTAVDGGTVIAGTNGNRTDVGGAAAERFVAATFDSTAYAGSIVIRVSDNAASNEGGQSILFGAGNDTVLFDQIIPTAANVSSAGLTINDTVNGGAGNDILAIDGNGVAISIGASEWTNVSNFEIIRLVGNGVAGILNGQNQVNAYNLTLTNELLAANGTATGGIKRVTIVNDNDGANDTIVGTGNTAAAAADGSADGTFGATGIERGVTIDATALNTTNSFVYNGEEGASRTADRFIFLDPNINGTAVINGGRVYGALNVVSNVGNEDVLEVRNSAVISLGDLAGISNVGNFEFTNNTSADQTVRLTLDNAAIERLVNDGRTSAAGFAETLNVSTFRSVNTAGADTALVLDAALVSNFLAVNVNATGNLNMGDDIVTVTANYSGTLNTLNLGGGTDVLNVRGVATNAVNVAGNVHTFVNGTTNANLALTSIENLNAIDVGGNSIALTITGSAGADEIYGTSLNDTINAQGGADTIFGNGGNDTINAGGGANVIVFSSAATNGVDTINSYSVANDTLNLLAVGGVLQGAGVANAAANHVLGTNDVVKFAAPNIAAGQLGNLTTVATALNGAGIASHVNDAIAGNSRTIILIDDGVDTGVYFFSDSATANSTIEVGELTHLATLVGIADATTVVNFTAGL